MAAPFRTALRGYDRTEVERLLELVDSALASPLESPRARARQALRSFTYRPRLGGYSRRQVDRVLREAARVLSS